MLDRGDSAAEVSREIDVNISPAEVSDWTVMEGAKATSDDVWEKSTANESIVDLLAASSVGGECLIAKFVAMYVSETKYCREVL